MGDFTMAMGLGVLLALVVVGLLRAGVYVTCRVWLRLNRARMLAGRRVVLRELGLMRTTGAGFTTRERSQPGEFRIQPDRVDGPGSFIGVVGPYSFETDADGGCKQ